MFRLLGSSRGQVQEERTNTTRVSNETTRTSNETARNRSSEVSASSHGSLQRPALLHQHQQKENSENMVTLHARLLQEAEKIRKWKIQTELDLKEKERRMAESSLRIETMKKSILELQLQNEKTSAKLEEEITSKGEVIKRIDATREMCNLLKSHASSVIDRLTRCETEKTELKYTNKEHLQQFQDLTTKFKNLKIQVVENEKKSKNHVDIERQNLKQKEEALKVKLDASENQIQSLNDVLMKKNEEIQNLEALLQAKGLKIENLELMTDGLHKNVSSLSKELETREAELRESALRIAKVQDEKSNLEKRLQGLEIDFGNLQTSKDHLALEMTEATTKLEQQLQLAQDDTNKVKNRLEEEQKKLSECESQLLKSRGDVENLKSARDKVLMEKKDVEMNEDMLKFQMSNLMAEKEENKEEIQNLNREISALNKKIDFESSHKKQAQDESETLQGKISSLEQQKCDNEDHIASLKKELDALQTKAVSLETLLSKKEEEAIKLQENSKFLERTIDSERQNIEDLEAQIADHVQDLAESNKALEEKKDSLDSTTKTLEALKIDKEGLEQKLSSSVSETEELRSTLAVQEEKIEELTNQLNDLAEQRKESGKNLTSQQKKAAATAKLNKELEKEVKALKSNLEKEKKISHQQFEKLTTMQAEMSALTKAKADAEASRQSCEEEMKNMWEQCEQDQKEAKLALKKAKEMQLIAEKEKENAQALTDCQLAEMMSTLETYKQNNEKSISEKDSEIEALRGQIEKQKQADMKHREEKDDCSKQINDLKDQLSAHEKEKEELMSKVGAVSTEREELKKQVKSLETQISSLKLCTVTKTNEKHTPLVKNTSPPVVQVTPQKQQSPRNPAPSTPKVSVPSTPRGPIQSTPKVPILSTPKVGTVPKTPSRSILRVVNSETKRRKVAFAAGNHSPSSSEESDLMEIDPDAPLIHKNGTPLLFTPTPKVERPSSKGHKSVTPGMVPLNRKPRGPPVKQTKPSEADCLATERVPHKPLYQDKSQGHRYRPELKKTELPKTPKMRTAPMKEMGRWAEDSESETLTQECLKTANIRKTPAKKSKFFSVSPRIKSATSMTKAKSKPKEGGKDTSKMAWFDLDSVYGFGPED